MKANHNVTALINGGFVLCSILRNFKNESKSQHRAITHGRPYRCVQYYEISKMKANHNTVKKPTVPPMLCSILRNFKNESKSQHIGYSSRRKPRCVQYYEISKMKANHNDELTKATEDLLCSILRNFKNESKSQPRKEYEPLLYRCVQYYEISKMKANHNHVGSRSNRRGLCSILRNFKNESKSQHITVRLASTLSCVQYYEISKMKANHNEYYLATNTRILISINHHSCIRGQQKVADATLFP